MTSPPLDGPERWPLVVALLMFAYLNRDLLLARLPSLPSLPEEDPQDALRSRYVAGEIGLAEYERELDLLMDTSNERIRERVEDVDGIGDVVSKEIALAFESVGHLERASREDLMAIDDVGPQRADDILDEL